MVTKQQKIDAIYEKIANKELSFGCIIQDENGKQHRLLKTHFLIKQFFKGEPRACVFFKEDLFLEDNVYIDGLKEDYKIIGHPVMIGDVMDYLDNIPPEELLKIIEETEKLFYIWKEKRKPIEEQSDECISFIYNLISEQGEK